MNKVILTGRITHNLQLKYTSNNKPVCNFSIAVNEPIMRDGERKADFIDCDVWGKSAENLVNYQNKGNLIAVIGRLKKEEYEKDGQKRYKTYVLVDEIDYLEKKSPDNSGQVHTKTDDPFEDYGASISIDDEDFPF